MNVEKSDVETKKDELIKFINSEEFDKLPLEEQLRTMLKTGQALIDFAREIQQELDTGK